MSGLYSGSMFVCECCGTVDSIQLTPSNGDGYKCGPCRGQSWHGAFPQKRYDPLDLDHRGLLNKTDPSFGDLGDPSFS